MGERIKRMVHEIDDTGVRTMRRKQSAFRHSPQPEAVRHTNEGGVLRSGAAVPEMPRMGGMGQARAYAGDCCFADLRTRIDRVKEWLDRPMTLNRVSIKLLCYLCMAIDTKDKSLQDWYAGGLNFVCELMDEQKEKQNGITRTN
jgi:hypothetical protein